VLQTTFVRQAGIFALGCTSVNEAFALGRADGWFCRRQCQGVDHFKANCSFSQQLYILEKKWRNEKNRGAELLILASLLKIFK